MPHSPLGIALAAGLSLTTVATGLIEGVKPGDSASAFHVMAWNEPVIPPARLVTGFRSPLSAWGPGHRGVDYLVTDGAVVMAPTEASVSFVGLVARKPVVSLSAISPSGVPVLVSFEPICSAPAVGEPAAAGTIVGVVCAAGYASHCAPRLCLHVSVRSTAGYLSPQFFLGQLHPSRLVD